ncbi:unnamed protein product [Discula destructiva]
MYPVIEWALFIVAVLLAILAYWRRQSSHENVPIQSFEKDSTLSACPMSSRGHWADNEPLQIRPFKPVYHITMALQNSNPSDLIIMDRNYKDRILERRQLIAQHPSIVIGAISQGHGAVYELYEYLMSSYLPRRFPAMFLIGKNGKTLRNNVTGATFPLVPPGDPIQTLKILGEMVEDDFFLLHEVEQGHRSVAYVCCYCSGFDPSKKLDKLLDEIHEPVPSYHKIGPSMERYFSRTKVGKNMKRVNWSVVDSPILFNCGSNHVHADDLEDITKDEEIDIGKARMRVELQTLSRLPKTGAIMFSFKTFLYTIEEIKAEGLGPQLADAIDGLKEGNAPDMWTYKGAVRWGKAVKDFLRS